MSGTSTGRRVPGLASVVCSGSGCVAPSTETIQDGSYKPLSRPLFMYPSEKASTESRICVRK